MQAAYALAGLWAYSICQDAKMQKPGKKPGIFAIISVEIKHCIGKIVELPVQRLSAAHVALSRHRG